MKRRLIQIIYNILCIFRGQKKKKFKEQKYGYGGQKKRSKYNDANSSAEVAGFKRNLHQPKTFGKQKVNNTVDDIGIVYTEINNIVDSKFIGERKRSKQKWSATRIQKKVNSGLIC